MDYKLLDGELTAEKLDKMETLQLVIRLFSNYVKDIAIWIKIFWALVTRYFLLLITSISYCVHALFYAILGLLCWIIALGMYNTQEFKDAKSGNIKVK